MRECSMFRTSQVHWKLWIQYTSSSVKILLLQKCSSLIRRLQPIASQPNQKKSRQGRRREYLVPRQAHMYPQPRKCRQNQNQSLNQTNQAHMYPQPRKCHQNQNQSLNQTNQALHQ
ncbi:hypothetical protein DPMN_081335 [Dreissena polymorpha]|uniref:Uncharacterized protein n=1 Tax=Dreissena polymorpha TaxID=45954 RepID=A0A9D3Y7V7_DREPO|nr:hypothetical protein DPMN_081335 [Dreissena polymorpha]